MPLKRVTVQSVFFMLSSYHHPLVQEDLVSAFDGISDLNGLNSMVNGLNSMAVEVFSSVLKKALTCTTLGNCPRPGVVLAAYPCSDFIRERMHTGIQAIFFYVNLRHY